MAFVTERYFLNGQEINKKTVFDWKAFKTCERRIYLKEETIKKIDYIETIKINKKDRSK